MKAVSSAKVLRCGRVDRLLTISKGSHGKERQRTAYLLFPIHRHWREYCEDQCVFDADRGTVGPGQSSRDDMAGIYLSCHFGRWTNNRCCGRWLPTTNDGYGGMVRMMRLHDGEWRLHEEHVGLNRYESYGHYSLALCGW